MDDLAKLQSAVKRYLEQMIEYAEWIGKEAALCLSGGYPPDQPLTKNYFSALEGLLRPMVGKATKKLSQNRQPV
ncbi:MAG: hypothetical protein JXL80_17775 [Planctomycetes bacterium]|nr:hypothetical protein [Planctomycetota bacterium]